MKAWENLKQYETGILINMGVSPDDKLYFHDALEQALTDLIKMRKNKGMTIRYFNTALTTDQRRNEHVRRIGEAKGLYDVEYHGYPKEWKLSDGIGHDALKYIIKDDKYSFGYLYKELMSEEQGYEVMGFDDDVIMYAIDFDIDEVQKALSEISSSEEKVTYLIGKKTQSQLVLCPNEDSVLGQLKHAYESQIQILLEAEKEIMALQQYKKSEVKEPVVETSEPVENTYLYYNPKIVDKGSFVVQDCANPLTFEFSTRCYNNDSMLKEIIVNYFKSCYCWTSDGIEWDSASNEDCTNKLSSLLSEYLRRLKKLCLPTAYTPLESGARWLYHTFKIVDRVYNELPEIELSQIDEVSGYTNRFDQSTIFFKRYIISSLIRSYSYEVFFNQYIIKTHMDIDSRTILYNLWGEGYSKEYERKSKEIGLIGEDRAKIYKDVNTDWFSSLIKKYAERFMASEGASYIEFEVYSDPTNFSQDLQKMFADYAKRIHEQVQPCEESKQMLVQWCFETIDIFLETRQKLSRLYRNDPNGLLDTFLVDYGMRPLVNIFNNFQMDFTRLYRLTDYDASNTTKTEKNSKQLSAEKPASTDTASELERVSGDGLKANLFEGLNDSALPELYQYLTQKKPLKNPKGQIISETVFVESIKNAELNEIYYAKGFTTKMRFAIGRLRKYANQSWIDKVCVNLGKTEKEVTGARGYNLPNKFIDGFPIK